MTSENKMREAQEALEFILDMAASSAGNIRGEEQVEHCGNIIRAALHSVEAEKEPVTKEMIKAGLDAIGPCMGSCGEASPPDGEDVEACYLAMKELDQATTGMQAEKERLVELAREMFSADSACGCGFYDDDRWRSAYFGLQVAVGSRESTCVFDPETDEFPAPPEHKPE